MLENVDAVQWGTLRHAYGNASDVPSMLLAVDSATDNNSFLKKYQTLMESINHQGDIYDSTGYSVPFIIQMLKKSTEPFRIIHHLIILAELLRHTPHHHYQQSLFPRSIVPYRPLLHVYEAVKGSTDYYLKLLSHNDEDIRAGSVYVLSFLVDEYTRTLPALHQCVEHSQNNWLRAGASWAYATVASYRLSTVSDAVTATNVASEHLQILEGWAHDSEPIVRFASAIGYISVLASDWARHNTDTPDHIVELVRTTLLTNGWGKPEPYKKTTNHIRYIYSEITPFNDTQNLVIRWCGQTDNPKRWVAILARLPLSAIKAHEFVREMLDKNFTRLGVHQHMHIWHGHAVLRPSEISDGVIYSFAGVEREYTNGKLLSDAQREVLHIICDCDPFWELPTNLFSFYYGLPDERVALCALSKQRNN